MAIILVGGGSRSGKSRHALELARAAGPRLLFIATAEASDEEMRERIASHQRDRGPEFQTMEAPVEVGAALTESADAIVVDCLTLWLSNLMLRGLDVGNAVNALVQTSRLSRARIIFVTNEVGCGIVPEHELARRFRDEAGRLNQKLASIADEVYWMIFGLPLRLK